MHTARAAVRYVSSELAAAAAQLPDASDIDWHSDAASLFRSRLSELTDLLKEATSALALADDDLTAQLARSELDRQANDAPRDGVGRGEVSSGVR